MNIDNIKSKLLECYSRDLCYPKVQDMWSSNNKYFGMCAITALVLNDYFGGNICKIHVEGISHYFNIIDSNIVDLTSSQFKCDVDYSNYEIISRDLLLDNDDTRRRYILLKEKLSSKL